MLFWTYLGPSFEGFFRRIFRWDCLFIVTIIVLRSKIGRASIGWACLFIKTTSVSRSWIGRACLFMITGSVLRSWTGWACLFVVNTNVNWSTTWWYLHLSTEPLQNKQLGEYKLQNPNSTCRMKQILKLLSWISW